MTDRRVYQCPNTGRFYDPLALRRSLVIGSKGRFNDSARDMRDPDPVKSAAATETIVAAGRTAFGLDPIDSETGEGVPDADVIEAVTAFTGWLAGKDETAQSGPNSAPCTGCRQAGN